MRSPLFSIIAVKKKKEEIFVSHGVRTIEIKTKKVCQMSLCATMKIASKYFKMYGLHKLNEWNECRFRFGLN